MMDPNWSNLQTEICDLRLYRAALRIRAHLEYPHGQEINACPASASRSAPQPPPAESPLEVCSQTGAGTGPRRHPHKRKRHLAPTTNIVMPNRTASIAAPIDDSAPVHYSATPIASMARAAKTSCSSSGGTSSARARTRATRRKGNKQQDAPAASNATSRIGPARRPPGAVCAFLGRQLDGGWFEQCSVLKRGGRGELVTL